MLRYIVFIGLLVAMMLCNCGSSNVWCGTYINFNYEHTVTAEMPTQRDTLELNCDYTFRSNHFGSGQWSIVDDLFNKRICLRIMSGSNYSICLPVNSFSVNKEIVVDRANNHYYRLIY